MRIGIDARLYRTSVAGIGRYSQNLIENLAKIDHENQYILLMTPEDAKEFKNSNLQFPNAKVVVTDIPHYSLAEQIYLPKILKAQKCDLWHFLNFNVPVGFKGKFVVTIHDLTLFFYEGRQKKNFIYKLGYKYIFGQACRNAKKIVAVSESTKRDILDVFKTPTNKVKVVYEAADDKTFVKVSDDLLEKMRQTYKIGEQSIILYVGQWRPHKNLTGLIEAFELLRKDMLVKLVIVGKVDPAFPEVSEAIDKSPNMSDIIKTGFVSEEELAAWYKLATVFVFPSFYEGFGLPGLEAMAAGIPVVSSDRTSLPEIYDQGAIYFNPSDSMDMKDKIKSIIIDPILKKKLIEEGRKVVEKFSWEKTAQETLSIYREIVK
ncbi:MAG: glycosyltransferase family 1 protein [Candidatus Berkelbacteria bacterium]